LAATRPGPDPASPRDPEAIRAAKEKVSRYYRAATEDYLKYYEADWHHHMHYGFDRDLPKGGNPTEQMVKYVAKVAGLLDRITSVTPDGPGPKVLDAGCGVGGSAIWLARQAGCRSVGITLVEPQARLAMRYAARHGVRPAAASRASAMARFAVNDFTRPAFKSGSFDAVWALESFDHAPDKAAWVAAMARILKPGGRLVIADGFRSGRPAGGSGTDTAEGRRREREERAYRAFLAGWAVPHLCTTAEMRRYAADAGLELVHDEDISADVMPHARAIYRFGLLFIPVRWVLHRLRLTSSEKLGNAIATYHQYHTFKRGMWTYRVFCFRKPG
jgi:SAM-dependent methyltransferase